MNILIRIAHIINPVAAPAGSDLAVVQPITFESMRVAKEFAQEQVSVSQYTVGYEEDREVTPHYFEVLDNLQHSVLDYGTFKQPRQLPLIAEILTALYDHTDAEWLIYTNADIALMPYFYITVAAEIKKGCDAIVINRRRISKAYHDVAELPSMYAAIGGSHPGYDCFIFHRSLFPHLILDRICIGVPFIEVSLLHNLIAFSQNLRLIDDAHLTFHIGMEVMPPILPEYYHYNKTIYQQQILPKIKAMLEAKRFPYAGLPLYRRLLKWGLNPSYSTALMLELEGKSMIRKLKILVDEMRWRILAK